MKLTLRRLAALNSPTMIVESLRHRSALRKSQLPLYAAASPMLCQATEKLGKIYTACESEAPAAALEQIEKGAWAALYLVRKLADKERLGVAAQAMLRDCFSLLIAGRVLVGRYNEVVQSGRHAYSSPLLEGGPVLEELCKDTIEDTRAFCREKHGDAPEVELMCGTLQSTGQVLLPSHVQFSLLELLKNSLGAHVHRVGVERLDELPPIQIVHGECEGWGFIKMSDSGGGLVSDMSAGYFLHSSRAEREATYTYSRAFGSPFEGLGMGLPLAQLHLQYLGGDVTLGSLPGQGVTAYLSFDMSGLRTDPSEVTRGK
eukprot:CAMPEP_0119308022 /NCGR_PEP_ID=MMETSP1333-20130426/8356_1 /TAXON_ID=418940 /ORGANISM="Scyphosphaera apsteinii, Strain RCC1455" /LENGTH=315 /DNA_ID=CAMNT_0007311703 /DNA_START=25 /DNA_END=972 /DNA_ORIENTATION=-